MVILIALGVYFVCSLSFRHVLTAVLAVYCVLFAGFEHYYFTEYKEECKAHFDYGFEQALDKAMEKGERVYMEQGTFYPKVLFYSQMPVEEFRETVQYYFYPSSYLVAVEIGRFSLWCDPYQPDESGAYIIHSDADMGLLKEQGFVFEEYGIYTVAYKD